MRKQIAARIRQLGESGVLTLIEVAGALDEHKQREATVAYLQEQLDPGSFHWQTVRERFDSYRWDLRKPRKR